MLLVLSPLLTHRMQLTDSLSHSQAKSHREAVMLCRAPEVITHLGAPEICDTAETLVCEFLLPQAASERKQPPPGFGGVIHS